MRIVYFDIETSNLNANYGVVLCACFLEDATGKIKTYRIDAYRGFKKDPANDKQLVIDIKKEIEEADILVSYNGKRFDIPFINARLAYWGIDTIRVPKHIDLYSVIKWHYRLSDYKLQTASYFWQTENQKTIVDGMHWVRALISKKSMDYIVQHCEQDVKVLKEVFEKVKASIKYIK
jgi:uncharacterized protein YprB with RNaseH-like and TPR domain